MSLLTALLLSMAAAGAPSERDEAPALPPRLGVSEEVESVPRWLVDIPPKELHRQVRIEQRVIIRIPRRRKGRQQLSTLQSLPTPKADLKERRIGKCLSMRNIAGVQVTDDNKLLLFMRDARIIRAELEKACRARDFYSGFYLEQSKDGRLCTDRDVLQARSGSKCEVERIRQLVRDED